MTAENSPCGCADDDHPGTELFAGGDQPLGERLRQPHMAAACDILRKVRHRLAQPFLPLASNDVFVCALGWNGRAARPLGWQHDDQVQPCTEAAGEASA